MGHWFGLGRAAPAAAPAVEFVEPLIFERVVYQRETEDGIEEVHWIKPRNRRPPASEVNPASIGFTEVRRDFLGFGY